MRKLLVLLVLVMGVAVSATGQDIKPFNLYLGGGISMPNGDFSDQYKLGLHVVGALGLNIAPGFQFVPKAEFHTSSIDQDYWKTHFIATAVDGGTLNTILAGADLRFAPPLPAAPIKPYLLGGGGWARLATSDLTVEGLEEPLTQTFEVQNKFFWNIGAGFELGSNPIMSFFVQARYLSISGDEADYNSIPVTVGIKF